MKHYNIKVYGRVQGVFFRASAKKVADKQNIKGFVQNNPDGSVYIEAEGEENNLKEFIEWCHKGPQFAQVEKLDVQENKIKGFDNFIIK